MSYDPKLQLLRGAKTAANNRYSFGGRLKKRNAPKPVTLPKLKCLEEEDMSEADSGKIA